MVSSKKYFFRAPPDFDYEMKRAMRELGKDTPTDFIRYSIDYTIRNHKRKTHRKTHRKEKTYTGV